MLANRPLTQGSSLLVDDVSSWKLTYYTQRATLLLTAAQTVDLRDAGEQRRLAALSRRLKDVVDGRVGIHLAVPVVDMATQLLRMDAPLLERAMDAHKWVLYAQQQRPCTRRLDSDECFRYAESSPPNSGRDSDSSAQSAVSTDSEDQEDEELDKADGQSAGDELAAATTAIPRRSDTNVSSEKQARLRRERYVSATNPHGFPPAVVLRLNMLSPVDCARAVNKLLAQREKQMILRADPVAGEKIREGKRRSYHKMRQLHRKQAAAKRQKYTSTYSADNEVT